MVILDNPLFKHKILIVAAPYYKPVVDRLIKAAKEVLFNSIQTDEIMEVSEAYCDGAFEIPRTIKPAHRLFSWLCSTWMYN